MEAVPFLRNVDMDTSQKTHLIVTVLWPSNPTELCPLETMPASAREKWMLLLMFMESGRVYRLVV
jgi:hypothetical protein